MARLNIEDTIFKDARYIKLMIKLGSDATAIGELVRVWFLGQHYWSKGKLPIPKATWKKQNMCDAVIEVGLVVEEKDGFYVCGAKNQFDWIIQKKTGQKRGGSRRAETAKRENDGKFASNESEKPNKNNVKPRKTKVKPATPPAEPAQPASHSHSHSHSHSQSHPQSQAQAQDIKHTLKPEKEPAVPPDKPVQVGQMLVAHFCEAWKTKYGSRYPISPKDAGLLSGVAKGQGLERSKILVNAYFKMTDSFFQTKRHDATTFATNLPGVANFADTGKTTTAGNRYGKPAPAGGYQRTTNEDAELKKMMEDL